MKAAVLYADRVTTVSPSYAGEIQTPEFGKGLDQIMRMESGKFVWYLFNGIDTDLLDPETDTHIPYHFSVDDLSGKAKDKAALQERVGLPVRDDVPLFGIVSRLTRQKGFRCCGRRVASTFAKGIFRLSCSVQEILDFRKCLCLVWFKPTQINFQRISHLMSNWLKKSMQRQMSS